MKRILMFLIVMIAAAGVAFSQSTNLKLPTSNSNSNFTITNSSSDTLMHVTGNGRVGIATSAPSQALEVKGKIVSDSGFVFPDGTTQTTAAVTSSKVYGYICDLSGQVVLGGDDFIFSNNGPLSGITHTAGTSSVVIPSTGTYKIEFTVSHTAGNGAIIAIVVNGAVEPSTNYPINTAAGEVTGTAMLTLSAGDTITLRNNSANTAYNTVITNSLPAVSASITITKL